MRGKAARVPSEPSSRQHSGFTHYQRRGTIQIIDAGLADAGAPGLITINRDGPAGPHLAVKIQRVIQHLHREDFFRAVQFEIFWYPP